MTFVQFANDECDYGMGLELGMDLFCYGSHVSKAPPSAVLNTQTHGYLSSQLQLPRGGSSSYFQTFGSDLKVKVLKRFEILY